MGSCARNWAVTMMSSTVETWSWAALCAWAAPPAIRLSTAAPANRPALFATDFVITSPLKLWGVA
ncbi:hypothetical protein D3C86_1735970 [compost metagenome]